MMALFTAAFWLAALKAIPRILATHWPLMLAVGCGLCDLFAPNIKVRVAALSLLVVFSAVWGSRSAFLVALAAHSGF